MTEKSLYEWVQALYGPFEERVEALTEPTVCLKGYWRYARIVIKKRRHLKILDYVDKMLRPFCKKDNLRIYTKLLKDALRIDLKAIDRAEPLKTPEVALFFLKMKRAIDMEED